MKVLTAPQAITLFRQSVKWKIQDSYSLCIVADLYPKVLQMIYAQVHHLKKRGGGRRGSKKKKKKKEYKIKPGNILDLSFQVSIYFLKSNPTPEESHSLLTEYREIIFFKH